LQQQCSANWQTQDQQQLRQLLTLPATLVSLRCSSHASRLQRRAVRRCPMTAHARHRSCVSCVPLVTHLLAKWLHCATLRQWQQRQWQLSTHSRMLRQRQRPQRRWLRVHSRHGGAGADEGASRQVPVVHHHSVRAMCLHGQQAGQVQCWEPWLLRSYRWAEVEDEGLL
jgi:hypothetical protein